MVGTRARIFPNPLKADDYMQLTPDQKRELEALEAMSDDDIDFSDIPESLDWSDAIRNAYELLQKGEPLPKKQTEPEGKELKG